jgi:hypothetical protein
MSGRHKDTLDEVLIHPGLELSHPTIVSTRLYHDIQLLLTREWSWENRDQNQEGGQSSCQEREEYRWRKSLGQQELRCWEGHRRNP